MKQVESGPDSGAAPDISTKNTSLTEASAGRLVTKYSLGLYGVGNKWCVFDGDDTGSTDEIGEWRVSC